MALPVYTTGTQKPICNCITEPCNCDDNNDLIPHLGVWDLKQTFNQSQNASQITVSISDWIKGHPYIFFGGVAIALYFLLSMLKERR